MDELDGMAVVSELTSPPLVTQLPRFRAFGFL
jgi:hypothetical protein